MKKEKILSRFNIASYLVVIVYKHIEIEITHTGNKYWFSRGKLHRDDGPAAVYNKDAVIHWYSNGDLHNENGPAVIYTDGSKRWYLNNIEHTEHGWRIELEKQKRIINTLQ